MPRRTILAAALALFLLMLSVRLIAPEPEGAARSGAAEPGVPRPADLLRELHRIPEHASFPHHAVPPEAMDQEIQRLGRATPVYIEELRRDFDQASDLYAFLLDRLPSAEAGDGASQYYVYLALEECRAYLRADPNRVHDWYADAVANPVPATGEDLYSVERHDRRCRSFAGASLDEVAMALGVDAPGSVAEYGSAWFERAVGSGYPPARVDWALRPSWTRAQRLALLDAVSAVADPAVYWQLFAAEAAFLDPGEVPLRSLAWLILACRAGANCREEAEWYRAWLCAGDGSSCPAGVSAIERYWAARSPQERRLAYTLADMLQARTPILALEVLPALADGRGAPP